MKKLYIGFFSLLYIVPIFCRIDKKNHRHMRKIDKKNGMNSICTSRDVSMHSFDDHIDFSQALNQLKRRTPRHYHDAVLEPDDFGFAPTLNAYHHRKKI